MKVKIIRGSVLKNNVCYKTGEIIEVTESEARAFFREGIVEKVQPVAQTTKVEKAKVAPVEEKKPEETKIAEPEPSLEWTRRELEEYAKNHGVKEPEKFASKSGLLEAIKGGEKK